MSKEEAITQKDKERKRRVALDWYTSHKEKGLCVICNKKALVGYTQCVYHLYKGSLKSQKYAQGHRQLETVRHIEWRDRMRLDGRCIKCGAPLIEEESVYCMNCSMCLYKSYPKKNMRGVLS